MVTCAFGCVSQLTLEYCLDRAEANYPMFKRYDLIARTRIIDLSDINKGWLPQVGFTRKVQFKTMCRPFLRHFEGCLRI